MSEPGEFAGFVRVKTLAAFGLREWDISSARRPWRIRLWRAVSFARRRGKALDAQPSRWGYRAAVPVGQRVCR